MRFRLALRTLRRHGPGRFLEMGCGHGGLLGPLAEHGFSGVAIEPSPNASSVAMSSTAAFRDRVHIVNDLAVIEEDEPFDYLLAFEVLEHVVDDQGSLELWLRHLRPGGTAVLSVPAHMKHWTPADDAVGHVRRYEREGFRELLATSGLQIGSMWSYGFPLTSLSRHFRDLHLEQTSLSGSQSERSLGSAAVSHTCGGESKSFQGLLRSIGWIGDLLQRPFLNSDLGDGYFAVATKR